MKPVSTVHAIQKFKSHFTYMVFSNGNVHPAWFSVPFIWFMDESKLGRHIFDPSNRVTARLCV